MSIQLEGNIKMGADEGSAVDVSADVYKVTISEERESVTRRPTFAKATQHNKAGASMAAATVAFEQNLDPTSSPAHKEITAAIRTSGAVMFLSGTFAPGAVSATNPEYKGNVIVTAVDTGGEVGAVLEQEQTWSYDENGFTINTGT